MNVFGIYNISVIREQKKKKLVYNKGLFNRLIEFEKNFDFSQIFYKLYLIQKNNIETKLST